MAVKSVDIPRAFVIRSSQQLFPNHQYMHKPPSKSYSNPHPHTGRSRNFPSVLVSPLHTPTHTRTQSRVRMRDESEEKPKAYVIRSSQEQIPNQENLRRPPGKSYPSPNSHTGRSRYVPSVL